MKKNKTPQEEHLRDLFPNKNFSFITIDGVDYLSKDVFNEIMKLKVLKYSQQTPQSHSYGEKQKGRKVSEKIVASCIGENRFPDADTHNKPPQFRYEYLRTHEELIKIIQECEGKHTQQVCYSTFHNCLTQIDWTDMIVRSNLKK